MDPLDRMSGNGGCKLLGAGATYDAIANPTLPPIHAMIIVEEGALTSVTGVSRDGDQVDVLASHIGSNDEDAAFVGYLITFGNTLVHKIVTGAAKVIVYFTPQNPRA